MAVDPPSPSLSRGVFLRFLTVSHLHHRMHDRQIVDMETVGDIGRADDLQNAGVVFDIIGTEAFRHIGIEVHRNRHFITCQEPEGAGAPGRQRHREQRLYEPIISETIPFLALPLPEWPAHSRPIGAECSPGVVAGCVRVWSQNAPLGVSRRTRFRSDGGRCGSPPWPMLYCLIVDSMICP